MVAGVAVVSGSVTASNGSGETYSTDSTLESEQSGGADYEQLTGGDMPESDEEAAVGGGSDANSDSVKTDQQEIIVEDIDDLQDIQNNLDADVLLRNDIDASETEDWNNGKGFNPIGSRSDEFTGTFDGRGHIIENLTINRPSESRVGLFGYGDDTTIENVRLENASITGESHVGGIAGTVSESSLGASFVRNTSVEGKVEGTDGSYTGGIVGFGTGGGSGQDAYGPVLDEENRFAGKVTGDRYVGGLLGRSNFGTEMGVGYVEDATVEGNEYVGGIVGFSSYNPSTFDEMYASATVNSPSDDGAVVGLIGDDGSGTDGIDQFPAVYWDEEVEPDDYKGAFTSGANPEADREEPVGLSTDEMTGEEARENMEGFDFTDRWLTQTNPDDYPSFFWEARTPDAPEAHIDISETTVEAGETIFVDAGGSDGDIDTYEWEFEDGVTKKGESVEHAYDDPGSYAVELTVTGPTGISTDRVEVLVSDGEADEFTVNPTTPEVGEKVEFASPGGDRYEWDFDDGTTAVGESPTHTFSRPGVYEVEMITDSEKITQAIAVEQGPIDITEVDTGFVDRAVVIEDLEMETEFRVEVNSDRDIESVVAEIQEEEHELTPAEDGIYTATIDLSSIGDDTVAEVTATDDLGHQDVEKRSIRHVQTPEWLAWMLDNAEEVADIEDEDVQSGAAIVLLDMEREFDELPDGLPWEQDFYSQKHLSTNVFVTSQGHIGLTVEGEGNVTVKGADIDLEGSGTGVVNPAFELERAEAMLSGEIEAPIWTYGYDPPIISEQEIVVTATGEATTEVAFESDDSGISFEEGSIRPGVGLEASSTVGENGAALTAGVDGNVRGDAAFELQDPYIRSFEIPVESSVFGTVEFKGYEREFDTKIVDRTMELYDADSSALTIDHKVTTEYSDWQMADKYGNPPQSTKNTAEVDATGLLTASEVDNYRLTERGLEDTHPTIAKTDAETVVMWTRQNESKDVGDGQDLAVQVNNDEWSDVQWVTDDNRHDSHPTVEPQEDGDAILTAWERVDAELPEDGSPDDVLPKTEIAVATANEPTDWTKPTLLSEKVVDRSVLTHQPVVAGSDDQWLVAWQRNENNTLTHLNDSHVDYTLISQTDSGITIEENGTISNAAQPEVASSSNGKFTLGYYKLGDNNETDKVSRSIIDSSGEITIAEQHEVEEFNGLTVSEDRLLWSEGATGQEQIRDTREGGEPEILTLDAEISNIDDIDIQTAGNQSVLTYRGTPIDGLTRDIMYRVEEEGDWTTDRRVAGGNDDLAVWHAATETDGNEFTTAYAKQSTDIDGVNDVFVREETFSPAYTVSGQPVDGDASVGDKTTIEYEIENVGLDAADKVEVELLAESEVIDSESVGPLEAGEQVSGTFQAEVPRSGMFTVDLADSPRSQNTVTDTEHGGVDEQEPWLPTSDTITVAEPSIGVGTVSSTFNETGAFAEVTISNAGNATATDVPVSVTSGSTWLANATIDQVKANDTATTTVAVDRSKLDHTLPETIVIDADDEVPDDWITDLGKERNMWLFQPEFSVEQPISYENRSGEIVADFGISNAGDIGANATVSIVNQNGTVIGERTFFIESDYNATVHRNVLVELSEDLPDNDEPVDIFVDSTRQDASLSTTGISDDFGPVIDTDNSPPVGVDEIAIEEETVFVDETITATAEIENTLNTRTRENVSFNVNGQTDEQKTLVLDPEETKTVEFTTVADTSGMYEMSIDDTEPVEIAVEKPRPDFQVTDISALSEMTIGEQSTVEYNIENTGNASATQQIQFSVAGDEQASTDMNLDVGEQKTSEFDYTPDDSDHPDTTLTVSSQNDSSSITSDVLTPPEFEITSIDFGAKEVNAGESLTVDVTVENTGEQTGAQEIKWDIGGQTLAVDSPEIGGGETETITFTEVVNLGSGEYTQTLRTDDDNEQQDLTVYESNFQVIIDESPANVTVGEEITIDVDISNIGGAADEQTIKAAMEDKDASDTETISLGADTGETVSFELNTTGIEVGNYTIVVHSDDHSDEAAIAVEHPETELEITIDNTTVNEDDTANITVKVENSGSTDIEDVVIAVETEDNELIENDTVDINAEDSKTVLFETIAVDEFADEELNIEATVAHGDSEETETETLTMEEEGDDDAVEEDDSSILVIIVAGGVILLLAALGAGILYYRDS